MVNFEVNLCYEVIIENLTNNKFAISDGFFSDAEVKLLREELLLKQEEENFRKAAIGNLFNEQVIKSIRGDSILWIDESAISEVETIFFSKIRDFIAYLNRTCYLGIQEQEFHYAIYPEGTFYKRHLDVFQNDDRRTLSMVLYLNDEDWQADYGGELALYLPSDSGEEITKLIQPLAGRFVIFDSKTLEHEVLKVKQPRYSITGWLKTR